MALATNTGVVLMSADARERPPVVALPAQVLTLEALMAQSQDQQNEDVPHDHAPKDEPTSASHQKSSEKDPAVRSAAGLTYVVASNGKLCSTAYRLESRIRSVFAELKNHNLVRKSPLGSLIKKNFVCLLSIVSITHVGGCV